MWQSQCLGLITAHEGKVLVSSLHGLVYFVTTEPEWWQRFLVWAKTEGMAGETGEWNALEKLPTLPFSPC